MRFDIKQISIFFCTTLAAACSGMPRITEPALGNAAPPQPAPKTLAAANNTPATAPTVAAAPANNVDASLVKAGYSVLLRHNQVLYCRNEIITGQRIATRICLTAAQIAVEKQNVTKAHDLMNQSSYRCMGASCNN